MKNRLSVAARRTVQPALDKIDQIAAAHAREQVNILRAEMRDEIGALQASLGQSSSESSSLSDLEADVEILRARLDSIQRQLAD